MTTTQTTVPTDAEGLLGYLNANTAWTYHLDHDEGGEYPVAVYVRTSCPRTTVYVPRKPGDPDHLAQAVRIVANAELIAAVKDRGELTMEPWLECCRGQYYDEPGAAYIHIRCGRLLRPHGDVHDHPLCTCYGKPTEPKAGAGTVTVVEI